MAAHEFVSGFTDRNVSSSGHRLAVTTITPGVIPATVKYGKIKRAGSLLRARKDGEIRGSHTLAWLSPEAGATGVIICCCIKYIVSSI
jgi:hypothetical protein